MDIGNPNQEGHSRYKPSELDLSHKSKSYEEAIVPQRAAAGTFYEPSYRLDVMADFLSSLGADSAVLYDDIYFAVDEHQRSSITGLAGYMRCALPAAEIACLAPAHVLCLAPPHPVELKSALQFVQEYGGNPSDLHVWIKEPVSGELIDLAALVLAEMEGAQGASAGMLQYKNILQHTRDHGAQFQPEQYVELLEELQASQTTLGTKTVVLPFQTREIHRKLFMKQIGHGSIVLPSSAELFRDKVEATCLITGVDASLERHFTDPISIQISRHYRMSDDTARSVTAECSRHGVDIAPRDFQGCAEQILSQMMKKEAKGRHAYVKLDSTGVSGVDNLNPDKFPEVYTGSPGLRINALNRILFDRFGDSSEGVLPCTSVEDRVERAFDEFGVLEYILSGIQNGTGFKQWCAVRAINDSHDVFQGVIGCTDPTRIGISHEMAEEMRQITTRVVEAMAAYGYQHGYVSKDFMYDSSDGILKINDHNDRRGGRSHLERVLSLHPGKVMMDRDYNFICPATINPIDYAMSLLDQAHRQGVSAYGTPMIFFPVQEGEDQIVKLKFVMEVPQDILDACTDQKGRIVELMDERLRSLLDV